MSQREVLVMTCFFFILVKIFVEDCLQGESGENIERKGCSQLNGFYGDGFFLLITGLVMPVLYHINVEDTK